MAINEENYEFRQEIHKITSKRKRIENEAEKNDDVVEKQTINKVYKVSCCSIELNVQNILFPKNICIHSRSQRY